MDNCLLDDEGVAKLGDFGLAHILPPGHDDQATLPPPALLLPPAVAAVWGLAWVAESIYRFYEKR